MNHYLFAVALLGVSFQAQRMAAAAERITDPDEVERLLPGLQVVSGTDTGSYLYFFPDRTYIVEDSWIGGSSVAEMGTWKFEGGAIQLTGTRLPTATWRGVRREFVPYRWTSETEPRFRGLTASIDGSFYLPSADARRITAANAVAIRQRLLARRDQQDAAMRDGTRLNRFGATEAADRAAQQRFGFSMEADHAITDRLLYPAYPWDGPVVLNVADVVLKGPTAEIPLDHTFIKLDRDATITVGSVTLAAPGGLTFYPGSGRIIAGELSELPSAKSEDRPEKAAATKAGILGENIGTIPGTQIGYRIVPEWVGDRLRLKATLRNGTGRELRLNGTSLPWFGGLTAQAYPNPRPIIQTVAAGPVVFPAGAELSESFFPAGLESRSPDTEQVIQWTFELVREGYPAGATVPYYQPVTGLLHLPARSPTAPARVQSPNSPPRPGD